MAEFFRQNVKLLSDKCFQNQTKWENGDLHMANVDGSPPSFQKLKSKLWPQTFILEIGKVNMTTLTLQ